MDLCDNVTITGVNVSYNFGSGIYLHESKNCIISGNYALNNTNYGIRIGTHQDRYSTNCTLSGNWVKNNSLDGVYMAHAEDCTVSGNIAVKTEKTASK